jgi:hypothetical protein
LAIKELQYVIQREPHVAEVRKRTKIVFLRRLRFFFRFFCAAPFQLFAMFLLSIADN